MSNNVSGKKQSDNGVIRERGASSSETSVYNSSADESVRSNRSKPSSFKKVSDNFSEYCCDPCSRAGKQTNVHGYCTNCVEYLCHTCFTYHSMSKKLKDHVLMDKDSMPRKDERLCEPCRIAVYEIQAVGYCSDCEEYLCSKCFESHSKIKDFKNHIFKDIDSLISGYTLIHDINVTKETDVGKNCKITGMTLVSNRELVICDYDNTCLKLVDVETSSVKDVLILKAKPVGITTISKDQVAVALENRFPIQIISIKGGLSIDRTIKATGDYMYVDVKCTGGRLYVSCINPLMFQILQQSGEMIKTIKPDSEVLKHCTLPLHIAISPDGSMIYLSDCETNTVLSIDMDGNKKSMYQDGLKHPHGIIVSPTGSVYLCNKKQNVVYKMTPDLREATVILGQDDGLSFPYAVCLNTDRKHLYVSSTSKDSENNCNIKVFQWK